MVGEFILIYLLLVRCEHLLPLLDILIDFSSLLTTILQDIALRLWHIPYIVIRPNMAALDVAPNNDPKTSPRGLNSQYSQPILTPASSTIGSDIDGLSPPTVVGGETWDGHSFPAVLWPGNVYLIIEKVSGRPIIRDGKGRVALGDVEEGPTAAASSQWLCVEGNNHIGFQNPQTGCYLGHDNDDRMAATAPFFRDCEYIIARPHPKGGYQLLSQVKLETLKLYAIGGDGKSLVRRMHGTTLFEFKKL